MRPPKQFCWLLLILALIGSMGAVVSSGGRYPSPYVDDWDSGDLHDGKTTCNAALVACVNASGRAIFKAGTYKISPTTGTALPDTVSVSGQGEGVTVLSAVAGETGAALTAGTDNTFTDLTIQGNDEATTTGLAIANGKHRVTCTRVEFKDFSTGASGGNGAVSGLVYRDCRFTSNVTGLGVGVATTGLVVDGSVFNGNTTTGLSLHGGPIGGTIVGNSFLSENLAVSMGTATNFTVVGNSVAASTPFSLGTAENCEFGRNSSNNNWPTFVSGTRNTYLGKFYGNAAPSTGTWQTGDVVWDISPTSADPAFYMCSAGASPGTWVDGPDVP